MVIVGTFYVHLKYFMATWFNFWPLGIVFGHLLFFPHFGMFGPRKIWQPCHFVDHGFGAVSQERQMKPGAPRQCVSGKAIFYFSYLPTWYLGRDYIDW
jgi:hypothetical protein